MRLDQYQEKTHEISHSATLAKALFRTQWHGYNLCLGYPSLQSMTQILSLPPARYRQSKFWPS